MRDDWERWLIEFKTRWAAYFACNELAEAVRREEAVRRLAEAVCPEEAVRRLAHPDPSDVAWLTAAMRQHARMIRGTIETPWSRMLVVDALRQATAVGEGLFQPLMDAGIDEVDPTENRWFIQPCMRAFGPRRVNEYLLEVFANGSDSRKAGAANAMYWTQVPPEFPGDLQMVFEGTSNIAIPRQVAMDLCLPESQAVDQPPTDQSLADIWERRRAALLVTFVQNENLHVRRAIIGKLGLDPSKYPDELRPLVPRAIEIARASGDEYIRHRVEMQLGAAIGPQVLPHRPRVWASG